MFRGFHTVAAASAKVARSLFKGKKGKIKHFLDADPDSSEKIWDRLNISKHEFFIRKYGNITPEERKKLDEKVARQKRLREARKRHELGDDYNSEPAPKMTLNPISEYLYGTHAVIAALTAGKRSAFNKLYIHNRKPETEKILQLAKKFGVKVVEKTKGDLNVLSSNSVHNGVVLETRPLQFPVIDSVGPFDESGQYSVNTVDEYSSQLVENNLEVARIVPDNYTKYPLGIFLDGITDPQNIGNIVRSAYYLGADFIVVPESESARLGPAAAKASAGALDMMPIYRLDDPMGFVDSIRKSSWNVVSTSSRMSQDELDNTKEKHKLHLENKYIEYSDLPSIMGLAPMLMIFGSEGSGVRTNLKFRSDYLVGLHKGREDPEGVVDSLNVGTAVGLLIGKCIE